MRFTGGVPVPEPDWEPSEPTEEEIAALRAEEAEEVAFHSHNEPTRIEPMADEPENLTLTLLREIRTDIAKVREEMREGFERVDERIAEVKSEVIKCRKEVVDADWVAKGIAVRLTSLEKRVKALEDARPEA